MAFRSAGQTLQSVELLFKLLADGSQARAELKKTGTDYAREIRGIEALGQRAITALSTPIVTRGGMLGSLAVSGAREALEALANKEIKAVEAGLDSVTAKGSKTSSGLAAITTSSSAVTAALSKQTAGLSANAAASSVAAIAATKLAAANIALDKSLDITGKDVDLFQKVLDAAQRQKLTAGPRGDRSQIGTTGASIAGLRETLGRVGVTVGGAKDPEKGLEQFIQGFARIPGKVDRAKLAVEVFGADVDKMLPKLEAARGAILASEAAMTAAIPAASGLTAVLGPLAVAAAAVVAGLIANAIAIKILFSIAQAAAEADEKLEKMSATLGVSVENLSALDIAAKKADAEGVAALRGGLNVFNRQLGEAAAGNLPRVSQFFRELGIDVKVAAKDTDTALIQIINRYNSLKDPTAKARLLQKLFSDETGKVGLTFREVGPDFEKFKQQLKDGGKLLTEEGAKKAKEFQDSVKALQIEFGLLGTKFGRELVPTFVRGLRLLQSEWHGVGSVVESTAKHIAASVDTEIQKVALLSAFLRTVQSISPSDAGFGTAFAGNLIAAQQQISRATADEEEERILENQRRLESATKARIDLAESAADAVKLIEDGVSRETDRQIKARQISLATALDKDLASITRNHAVEINILEEKIREEKAADLKGGEVEANRTARLAVLRNRKLAAEIKYENDVLDARQDFADKQRNLEDQARAAAIAVQKEQAARQIAALQDQAGKRPELAQSVAAQIAAIEEGITAFEGKELIRRLSLERAGSEEHKRIAAELAQHNIRTKADEERRKREIEQAGLDESLRKLSVEEAKADARGAGDQGLSARLRDEAQFGVLTRESAETQIKKVMVDGFNSRIQLLRDEIAARQKHNENVEALNARLSGLEQEKQNAIEEADRNIRDARRQDIVDLATYAEQTVQLELSITQQVLALKAQRVRDERERLQRRGLDNRAVLEEQVDVEHQREAVFHAANVAEIRAKIKAIQDDGVIRKGHQERLKQYYRELAAEQRRHADEEYQIELDRQRRLRELQLQDPASSRSLFGDVFADELERTGSKMEALHSLGIEIFHSLGSEIGNFKDLASGAFGSIGQGLGSFIEQWALLGTTGPSALRKLAASVLASFAAQALVKALFLVAEGVEYLAKAKAAAATAVLTGNPAAAAAAALYGAAATAAFKSAAMYALVGGGAAVAARALAGDRFQTGSGAAGGGGGTAGAAEEKKGPEKTSVARREAVEHRVHVRVDLAPGLVAKHFVQAVDDNNQEVRDRVTKALN